MIHDSERHPRIRIRPALLAACVLVAGAGAGEDEGEHWAYQPIRRPPPPRLERRDDLVQNPIDRFVNARLESESLRPRGEARRETLIRRLSIDLRGLPPTPEEIATFLRDSRPDAFERLVERLLASPRFGERWGRHWLDLVRYAESDGFKSDKIRSGAWRYRDYMIRAINEDKAYDRFIHEQLAGDEIAPDDSDALVATGYLRHWPYEDNGRDLDRLWDSILTDVTDTTAQVFMGLTVGCARCHDHKFDAIPQREYYSLRAFFAAMVPRNDLPVASSEEIRDHYRKLEAWNEATASLRDRMRELREPYHQKAQRDKGKQFPPFVKEILSRPESERSIYERQLVHLAGGQLRVEPKKMMGKMSKEVRASAGSSTSMSAKNGGSKNSVVNDHTGPKVVPSAFVAATCQ